MADGDDLIALDGTDQMDEDGVDLLFEAATSGCHCACNDAETPHHICSDVNTCNQWCKNHLRAFVRGPDCECPCPGRKDFPPAHRLTFSYSVAGGTFDTTPGFNDDFPTYRSSSGTGTAVIIFGTNGGTGCTVDAGIVHVAQTLIAPDGITEGATYEGDLTPVFGFETSNCGTSIAFSVTLDTIGGLPSNSGTVRVASAIGAPSYRCALEGSAAGNSFDRLIASVSDLTWEAVCEDCLGAPFSLGTDRASICAAITSVTITYWNGTGYETITTTPASVNIRTVESPGETCCPLKNPNFCADCGGPRDTSVCEECWEMNVPTSVGTVDVGQITFWGRGSCPSNFVYHSGGDPDHPATLVTVVLAEGCDEDI